VRLHFSPFFFSADPENPANLDLVVVPAESPAPCRHFLLWISAMKNKIPNAVLVWKQLDDLLVPRLPMNVIDRAVYSHLLRHSRLVGKPRLRFSMAWLARGVRICDGAARPSVRRLLDRGALRLLGRSKTGHIIRVLLPNEIRLRSLSSPNDLLRPNRRFHSRNLDDLDFFRNTSLRSAIHAREGGLCFYCLRHTTSSMQCLDHVVPQTRLGANSYRNLVSCCLECNSRKGQRRAADFLRSLYRQRRLTGPELTRRLRALDRLAAGKLRPTVPTHPPLAR
jgi:5-methylcytosine-specific restriction endonuclease McrA